MLFASDYLWNKIWWDYMSQIQFGYDNTDSVPELL